MELYSGNIMIRVPVAPMKAGDIVIGHAHNFGHTMVGFTGGFDIDILRVLEFDAFGLPVQVEVVETHTIISGAGVPTFFVAAGVWHRITAKVDGSTYGCFYSHQYPQALNMMEPGSVQLPPVKKRDEGGYLWYRVNEDIVQEANGWVDAYK